MKFTEVLTRLTGLSTPIFGVSWNPPEAESVVARRVISFLEDRRVLYVPSEMEVPDHCVRSILEIRQFLSQELGSLNTDSNIAVSLRAMRAACRKFLAEVGEEESIIRFGSEHGHWASWRFNGAVGELRGVFGVHLARLASCYGQDIEDELASILPDPGECNET